MSLITTTFFVTLDLLLAFFPLFEAKTAVFSKWDALLNPCYPSPVLTLLISFVLVARVVALELQVAEALDEVLSSTHSHSIVDTFANLRLRRLRQAFDHIQTTKGWLENRYATQKTVIQHFHVQLRKDASRASHLQEAFKLSRTHTARAAGEAAALKARNFVLLIHQDKLERKHAHAEGEKAVAFKILGVRSYPELITRGIERTAECDNLRDKNVRLEKECAMSHTILRAVVGQNAKLSEKFVALKNASEAMQATIFDLQREKQQLETTVTDLMTNHDGLGSSVEELTTERINLYSSLGDLKKEHEKLTTAHDQLTLQKKGLETTVADLTTDSDGLKVTIDEFTKDRVGLQMSSTEVTEERKELTIVHEHLMEEYSACKTTVVELSKERDELKTKMTELDDMLDIVAEDHVNLKQYHKASADRHEDELALAHTQLSAVTIERDRVLAELAKAPTAAEVTALAKEVVEHKNALSKCQVQLASQMTERLSELERLNEAYQDSGREMAAALTQDYEATLLETEEASEEKDEIIEMLRERIEHLESAQEQCGLQPIELGSPKANLLALPSPPLTPKSPLQQSFFPEDFQVEESEPDAPAGSPTLQQFTPVMNRGRRLLLAGVLIRESLRACKAPEPNVNQDVETLAMVPPEPVERRFWRMRLENGVSYIPRPTFSAIYPEDYENAPILPVDRVSLVNRPETSRIPVSCHMH